MLNFIAALVMANAFAQTEGYYKVSVNGKSCGELLTVTAPAKTYTELDYAMSDLEGLFFKYLEQMQNIDQTPESRLEYAFKDLLNLKAEILNDVISVLPYVAVSTMEEARKNKLLNSVYQIIDTMGIPAKVYGFQVAEDGSLSFPGKRRPQNTMKVVSISPAKEAIGFLGGKSPSRDLPDGEHRSIGFGTHTISGEKAPARVGGSIQRSVADDGQEKQLLIIDGETGTIY